MSTSPGLSRMGHQAWARVLVGLHREPKTHARIVAERGNSGDGTRLREQLWGLVRMGVAHVCRWECESPSQRVWSPVFAGGPGVNAPYPAKHKRPPGQVFMERRVNPELLAFSLLIQGLMAGATRAELTEQTGVHHHYIVPLVRLLRELGFAHISGWVRSDAKQAKWAQVLKFGPGADARKPPKQPRLRVARRSDHLRRARQKQIRMIHLTAGPITHQAAA